MVANDPHNRKPPLLLGFIAMVSGILLALFVISKVNAASEPQYIFYVNGTLYGTNTQRDIWVYPSGILDQSNVVYSYGPANAVQTVYTKVNGNWIESEAPVHLQSTLNFTMVKGTFSYTNYEPEYVDEHFITLTFDTAYSPKPLVAPCTECSASDPFYNVVYFQDHNSFRWYCYAHNGDIRFCNDNVILVQPSGALWYWETQDDQGDRWVLLDTSHVAVQGTDYLVYRAMWVIYARGNNLLAVTDYSSATVPSWPPTHGAGHSFNDGYITPISDFGYDDTCTIDYLQCVFADPVEEDPTPSPTSAPVQTDYVYCKMGSLYYLFDIVGSNVGTLDVQIPYNSILGSLQSEYNSISDLCIYNGFASWNTTDGTTGRNKFSIWFNADSVSSVKVYMTSSEIVDFDYIRQNVDPLQLIIYELGNDTNLMSGDNQNQSKYYVCKDTVTGKRYCISYQYYYNASLNAAELLGSSFSNFNSIVIPSDKSYALSFSPFAYDYNPILYKYGLLAQMGFLPQNNPIPSPTPTQGPPTPTPPPYVIIITPDPSPTPTPPFVIPTMPPWNPPGNQIVPLDPETQDNVFGVFKNKIGDNNAFGLIGLLIGLLPGDLMWYLWFLLFILLVVGTAKLIIHFTGG